MTDEFDAFADRDSGPSPIRMRQEANDMDREDIRSQIESAAEAIGFEADDRREYPDDDDDSLRADVIRAAGIAEENSHDRALEARRMSQLQALDQHSRDRYGQPLEQAFATLADGHDRMFSNPNQFAREVEPNFRDLNGYWNGIHQQRQMTAHEVVERFAEDKNIKPGSALERHMTRVMRDGDIKRTGDLRRDLNAAYQRALQLRKAAA